jgi:tRNA A37 methylthiotransferase MiaB
MCLPTAGGTPAATLHAQVDAIEKKRRAARLIETGVRKRADFARQWIGRKVQILIESTNAAGWSKGWTGEYLPAQIRGRSLRLNSIVDFQPELAKGEILIGNI